MTVNTQKKKKISVACHSYVEHPGLSLPLFCLLVLLLSPLSSPLSPQGIRGAGQRRDESKWEGGRKRKRTVWCPITSGDHAVDTLLRVDLLAKRRNAGVRDERRVERVHAFPWCVSCVSAAGLSTSATQGARGFRVARFVGGRTYVRSIPPRGIAARGRTRTPVPTCRLPRGDTCRVRCLIKGPPRTQEKDGNEGKAATTYMMQISMSL